MDGLDDTYFHPKNFKKQETIREEGNWVLIKVSDNRNGQHFSVKFLKHLKSLPNIALSDFFREFDIFTRLNHPSILKYKGYSPTNFKKKYCPTIYMEYVSVKTLKDFQNLDDTKKLIIIYGIASGMSYLHSHDIVHRDLKPDNIFIDDHFYPKIFNFHISKELTSSDGQIIDFELRNSPSYTAPEYLSNLIFSKSSDVFSFAMIMHEIITNENQYEKFYYMDEIITSVTKQKIRPKFNSSIADCYKELIEKCWSEDPKERPTFDEIVYQLRTNPKFITEKVNKEEFYNYIQYIDDYQITFESPVVIQSIEDIKNSEKFLFNIEKVTDKMKSLSILQTNFDLSKYKIASEDHDKRRIYEVYDVINKDTKLLSSASVYMIEIHQFNRCEIRNFCREINIISQLNHPSILKFIGYSSTNFKNEPKPVVINEKCQYNLAFMLSSSLKYEHLPWDDTKKLINIYGIASAMSYLHSHGILHRDLKPSNIYVDENLYPKMSGFHLAKEIKEKKSEKNKEKHIIGTPAYLAPEIYLNGEYSEKSDVYSFSLIIYEIITKNIPFININSINEFQQNIIEKNERPSIETCISTAYRQLIERCWDKNPSSRPTFEEILKELETNKEFITDTINEEEYRNYIKALKDFDSKLEPNNRIQELDEILNDKLQSFTDFKITSGLKNIYYTEYNDISLLNNLFDIKKFTEYSIGENSFYIINGIKHVDKKYMLLESKKKSTCFYKHEILNFTTEMNLISQINHPSILKYVGHNPLDFQGEPYPVIVLEYPSDISLHKLLKNERKQIKSKKWNDTKKLINIYGIASAMSYLHSHGILHRDLKPSNIYVDENLYPKMSGFHLAKEIKEKKSEKNKEKHIIGTPAYLAPEIYLNGKYSEKSDVYSFSLIMYEIITKNIPFTNINSINEFQQNIIEKNERPSIETCISTAYRQLIERCWDKNPSSRPTFEEILKELETNKEFITDTIDEEEYRKYIKSIANASITFEPSKKNQQLEQFVEFNMWRFKNAERKVSFKNIYETETYNIILNFPYINTDNFEIQKKIDMNKNYKICTVVEKRTEKTYLANIFTNKIKDMDNETLNEISNALIHMEKISHPSILKMIGFCQTDFKGKNKIVIITEHGSNGSLDKIIEFEGSKYHVKGYDITKKLIIIYGIASIMLYLHSNNIIHCELTPKNIFLDNFLFPKITGFYKSLEISKFKDLEPKMNTKRFEEITPYDSKEVIDHHEYSPASDVFAFGMIIFAILSSKKQFDTYNKKNLIKTIKNPIMYLKNIDDYYQKLILKCISQNSKERPTFEEIVFTLKNIDEFVSDKVNKEEYYNYIKYMEQFETNIGPNKQIYQLYNPITSNSSCFRKVNIDFNVMNTLRKLHFTINMGAIDLSLYNKETKIGSGCFGNVYKAIEKMSGNILAIKISKFLVDQCPENIIIDLSREINIMSKFKHPAIINFIGYNPYNFNDKPKPVIITEFAPNGSLADIIELERKGIGNHDWNETKKLINIYGIASGMLCIHKQHILHRDLKPDNILLDEFLYPKIGDFGLSKNLEEKQKKKSKRKEKDQIGSGFKGTYLYAAPEIISTQEYSEAGDVYAFGMILYEIITNEILFENCQNIYQLIKMVCSGNRPKFNFFIPNCYKNLITRCWDEKKENRPSFQEIVDELEQNKDFISSDIDEDEYLNYIFLVKNSQQKQNKFDLKTTKDCKKSIDKHNSSNSNEIIIENKNSFIDLNKFERGEIISKGETSKLYKLKDISTKKIYFGQISKNKINSFSQKELNILDQDLNVILSMNHPVLLKFIGYSPIDFKNQRKPVIITEFSSKYNLSVILELEKENCCIDGWDDTKKLINIYGIASGMSYLHSKGLIHCNLKPETIFLDEVLSPKIGDFGLSTRFENLSLITHQSIARMDVLPEYSAPEVLTNNNYSKASDVYSYSLIVYNILMNKIPYQEIDNKNQIINEVIMNQNRPELNQKIPTSYKKLIEKCWSQDPKDRLTFDEIVTELESNPEFLTPGVNKEDYLQYINFIHENQSQNILPSDYKSIKTTLNEQIQLPHKIIEDDSINNQNEPQKENEIQYVKEDIL